MNCFGDLQALNGTRCDLTVSQGQSWLFCSLFVCVQYCCCLMDWQRRNTLQRVQAMWPTMGRSERRTKRMSDKWSQLERCAHDDDDGGDYHLAAAERQKQWQSQWQETMNERFGWTEPGLGCRQKRGERRTTATEEEDNHASNPFETLPTEMDEWRWITTAAAAVKGPTLASSFASQRISSTQRVAFQTVSCAVSAVSAALSLHSLVSVCVWPRCVR